MPRVMESGNLIVLLIQSSLLLKARDIPVELFQASLDDFQSTLDLIEPIFDGPEANVYVLPELITLPDNNHNVHRHSEENRKHWYADGEVQLLVCHLIYPQ